MHDCKYRFTVPDMHINFTDMSIDGQMVKKSRNLLRSLLQDMLNS